MGIVVARKPLLLICAILLIQSASYSQSGKNGSAAASSTAPLAKPVDLGFFTARLFHDEPQEVAFHLKTSWIPGENHKGMLRYQLTALPASSAAPNRTPLDIELEGKLMERVHRCVITLNLHDKGGFILRKHDVAFTLGVDDQVRVRSLYANDACQMDAQEYRDFVGNSAGPGSWNVSWYCGDER
jgi:hypothetical protein